MYRHILIPTDGSETADKAVAAGTEYASEAGAKVVFFIAMPQYQLPRESEVMARHYVTPVCEYEEEAGAKARKILDKAAAAAKALKVDFDTEYAFSDRPYEAIIAAAKKHGCDAIFIGSHGRSGLAALWHGSQTRDLLTHCDIPTLVYR
jgi:nucleotide-binding universal stress UspA family protein